jgi:hypothetical protein
MRTQYAAPVRRIAGAALAVSLAAAVGVFVLLATWPFFALPSRPPICSDLVFNRGVDCDPTGSLILSIVSGLLVLGGAVALPRTAKGRRAR